MLLATHFNTIIHPFTLADNLHYVFYVFRILLLHPAFKYAAIPVYITFAWLVINALRDVPCCVEAECHFHYLGDSGLYMYTKAAAWATVATVATVATPLPMWGVEGSGMVL
jgi:hypothetical protein